MGIILSLVFIPYTVNRLHDINLPGQLALIAWFLSQLQGQLLIFVGIFSIFLYLKKSDKNTNEYGKVPQGQPFMEALLNNKSVAKLSDISFKEWWTYLSVPSSFLILVYSQSLATASFGFSYDPQFIGRTIGQVYLPLIIFLLPIVLLITLPFYFLNKKQGFLYIFSIVLFIAAIIMLMGSRYNYENME